MQCLFSILNATLTVLYIYIRRSRLFHIVLCSSVNQDSNNINFVAQFKSKVISQGSNVQLCTKPSHVLCILLCKTPIP